MLNIPENIVAKVAVRRIQRFSTIAGVSRYRNVVDFGSTKVTGREALPLWSLHMPGSLFPALNSDALAIQIWRAEDF